MFLVPGPACAKARSPASFLSPAKTADLKKRPCAKPRNPLDLAQRRYVHMLTCFRDVSAL